MAQLNAMQKVKVRHHLGYLNVQDAQTFVLGVPAGVQTQFIIEGAMDRVLTEAIPEVNRHIEILDQIEAQRVGDLELMAVNKLGEIEVNQEEQKQLTRQYDYWVDSLGNLLGCTRNPYDKRMGNRGINVAVRAG